MSFSNILSGLSPSGGAPSNDLSGGLANTYQSILGSALIEMWHSQLGVATVSGAADTWTGQVRGVVLQAPGASQRPIYGADGSNFGGKSVVQCAKTGSKYMLATGFSGALLAGSRPWIFSVQRARSLGTGGSFPWCVTMGTATVEELAILLNSGGAGSSFGTNFMSVNATSAGADTTVHGLQGWADGTNVNIAVDAGAPATAATALALSGNVTSFAVGTAITATTLLSDVSVALFIVCSAYPGAAAAAATLTLARSAAEFSF